MTPYPGHHLNKVGIETVRMDMISHAFEAFPSQIFELSLGAYSVVNGIVSI